MDKFQNKYRIPSARASFWDYGSNAAYFVTICTHNRKWHFGQVVDGEMALSEIGRIAYNCWMEIPEHFPFVKLDAFVVMPNHVHGVIIIDKPLNGPVQTQNIAPVGFVETQYFAPADGSRQYLAPADVQTQYFASLPPPPSPPPPLNQFGPQSQNLASIIRGFKIGVTKNARLIIPEFAWQPRYHDHIIRDDGAYQRISEYILNNPLKWNEDKFFKK